MGAGQSGLVQRSASIETTKIADQALKRSFNAVEKQQQRCNQIDAEVKNLDRLIKDTTQKREERLKSKASCLDVRDRMKFNADKLKTAVTIGEGKNYYNRNRENTASRPVNGGYNQGQQRQNNAGY